MLFNIGFKIGFISFGIVIKLRMGSSLLCG